MMRLSFVVLSVAVLAFAPAPFAKKERRAEDLSDVAGTWEVVAWLKEEKPAEPVRESDQFGQLRVLMKKDWFSYGVLGSRDPAVGFSMTLYPMAQPPGFILKRKGEARVEIVGSYRLQKGQMTMICCPGGQLSNRPTDFSKPAPFRIVLRRISRD